MHENAVPLAERFSVSPEEASALTGIGMTSIRAAIKAGDLVAHRHGTKIVILPDDIKAWLQRLPSAAAVNVEEMA